jgi:hypothetical protein
MKLDDDRNTRVALFQKREIRRTIHDGEWWFVITDIIAALTDSADPSGYWKKMRKRDPDLGKALEGGGQFVPPLSLEFATAGGPQNSEFLPPLSSASPRLRVNALITAMRRGNGAMIALQRGDRECTSTPGTLPSCSCAPAWSCL